MFPIKYHEVKLPDGGLCVYTTEPFVDVDPPTRESLEYAVNAVRRRNPQTEFVAYQGFLPWTVCPAQAG
jgi:hypothetical protein